MRNIFFVFILAVDVIQMLGFHCERTIKEKKWKPSSNEIPAASQTHTHTRALVHRPLLIPYALRTDVFYKSRSAPSAQSLLKPIHRP